MKDSIPRKSSNEANKLPMGLRPRHTAEIERYVQARLAAAKEASS